MAKKKSVKKKSSKKKTKKKKTTKKSIKKPRVSTQKVAIEMQPVLVNNFVALQKVMVSLASKLDDVSIKMQKLLDLFELSAKTLAKKDFKLAGETSPEVLKKLGELSEQNKVIAKGLTMIHEAPAPMPAPTPQPVPRPGPMPTPAPTTPPGEYKKSTPFKPLKPKTSK
jgi:hypothetical protein